MQSKTSLFNSTLFWKNIKRFWPLWTGYLLLWFMLLDMPIIAQALSSNYGNHTSSATGEVLNLAHYVGTITGFLFGAIASMAVWQFLYTGRSASFMSSLPIRREGIFITNYLSALLTFLACNAVIVIITLLAELAAGILMPSYIFQWFTIVSMQGVCFLGIGMLTAMLTGSLVVLPVLYLFLNFGASILQYLSREMLRNFVYGMPWYGSGKPVSNLDVLSPAVRILNSVYVNQYDEPYEIIETVHGFLNNYHYLFIGMKVIIIYCIVGLVLALLAMQLYKRRKVETASDVIAIAPLRPVFRYLFAYVGAIVWAAVFASAFGFTGSSYIPMAVHLIIGCFIGYFVSEMIIQKSFKVWRGKWIGFGVSSCVLIFLVVAVAFDLTGYERRIPDEKDIEAAEIYTRGYTSGKLTEPENIKELTAAHKSFIDNKSLYTNSNHWGDETEIMYTLSDGSELIRIYRTPFYEDMSGKMLEDSQAIEDILNTPEAIGLRNSVPAPVNENSITDAYIYYYDEVTDQDQSKRISVFQAAELYNDFIAKDMESLSIGRAHILSVWDRMKYQYDCSIHIEISYKDEDGNNRSHSINIRPTKDSEHTNQWLTEKGIPLITQAKRDKFYQKRYPPTASDDPDYAWVD